MINSRTNTVITLGEYSVIKIVGTFFWCTLTDLQLFDEVNKNINFSRQVFILQALDALLHLTHFFTLLLHVITTYPCQ